VTIRRPEQQEKHLKGESSQQTSWIRVLVAAVLCFFLGLVFAGALTFETYSVNVFTQTIGFLAAVWIAWKVARERVFWAVMPTAAFWLMVLAVTFKGMTNGELHVRSWLTIAGITVACLVYAWWLGTRTRPQPTEPAQPLANSIGRYSSG
jgi:hypothetical protein